GSRFPPAVGWLSIDQASRRALHDPPDKSFRRKNAMPVGRIRVARKCRVGDAEMVAIAATNRKARLVQSRSDGKGDFLCGIFSGVERPDMQVEVNPCGALCRVVVAVQAGAGVRHDDARRLVRTGTATADMVSRNEIDHGRRSYERRTDSRLQCEGRLYHLLYASLIAFFAARLIRF